MSDTLNVRDYLRSQGFTVGERGRFSAEMIEAAKAAGYLDENGKTPKVQKVATSVPKAPRPTPSRPTAVASDPITRPLRNKNFVAVSGNIRLTYDTCFGCVKSTTRCNHETPIPPKGFTALDGASGLV